jgi:quinoprotein glucose dehydrogenase
LIVGDVAVLGALVADQLKTDAPSGVVRAFDVRTGRLVWAWDPVPPGWKPDPVIEGELYQRGTPNVWSLLSGDAERGLVFVPTGNPSPDSYGGLRRGIDYYGSSTVALDGDGEVVALPEVHHDIWTTTRPRSRSSSSTRRSAAGGPQVIQPTEGRPRVHPRRETARRSTPVEERPRRRTARRRDARADPAVPDPSGSRSTRAELTPETVFGFTPWDRGSSREQLARYRYDGPFTPPDARGIDPDAGHARRHELGRRRARPRERAHDPNQSHFAIVTKLVPRAEFDAMPQGSIVYPAEAYPMKGTPYGVIRHPLFSSFGAPCSPPPWGSLTAVDLSSGAVAGACRSARSATRRRSRSGRSRVPASRLAELRGRAAHRERRLLRRRDERQVLPRVRRRDRRGDLEHAIPYTGNASPMSYRLRPDARQFVVIAAGGNPLTGPGDALLAFALQP